MGISQKFEAFCSSIKIKSKIADTVSQRYKQITKRINLDYYNSFSDTNNSLYVGSYGRKTAIHVSDIDMLVVLPYSTYSKFDKYSGNGQSALLQEVKAVLQKTYSTSHIRGDGQVIVIKFNDGIVFEIVPVFINQDNRTFTYPDTNDGGSWKVTNPKDEIDQINKTNGLCNKNLKRLCHMARSWKDQCNVDMGGLLIDTLAHNFIKNWSFKDKSYLYYDFMVRDFFEYLSNQSSTQAYWLAPGSNQYVYKKANFMSKALTAYNTIKDAIYHEGKDNEYSANLKWREVFGNKF